MLSVAVPRTPSTRNYRQLSSPGNSASHITTTRRNDCDTGEDKQEGGSMATSYKLQHLSSSLNRSRHRNRPIWNRFYRFYFIFCVLSCHNRITWVCELSSYCKNLYGFSLEVHLQARDLGGGIMGGSWEVPLNRLLVPWKQCWLISFFKGSYNLQVDLTCLGFFTMSYYLKFVMCRYLEVR